MPKSTSTKSSRAIRRDPMMVEFQEVLWRLDRLERQVQTLSELVRGHAEDEDRLVRIVAEDHEVLRRELVRQHQHRLRLRKRAQSDS